MGLWRSRPFPDQRIPEPVPTPLPLPSALRNPLKEAYDALSKLSELKIVFDGPSAAEQATIAKVLLLFFAIGHL